MASSLMRLRQLNCTSFRILDKNLSCLNFNLSKLEFHQDVHLYPRFQAVSRIKGMSGNQGVVNITIDELKKFQKDPSATIVDVREVSEIQETGKLPGSIHIPLGTLSDALKQENEKFQQQYNKAKPLVDNPLVFSCRSGRRSYMASETAVSLGYKKVFNYAGGWIDWAEHSGEVSQQK